MWPFLQFRFRNCTTTSWNGKISPKAEALTLILSTTIWGRGSRSQTRNSTSSTSWRPSFPRRTQRPIPSLRIRSPVPLRSKSQQAGRKEEWRLYKESVFLYLSLKQLATRVTITRHLVLVFSLFYGSCRFLYLILLFLQGSVSLWLGQPARDILSHGVTTFTGAVRVGLTYCHHHGTSFTHMSDRVQWEEILRKDHA